MPLKWKIISALVAAGLIVFTAVVLGLWWFNTDLLPILKRNGLEILMLPGALLFVFLMGFAWYKIFFAALHLMRADLDSE